MKEELPFVSVCTPTFNRRPFIPFIKRCFLEQDYPQERMEWIVVDDGTDKVRDLFTDIPNVKYFSLDEKMKLGKKRNYMHTKCSGDIIVYMDDDDYYPPERVSHAVERLQSDDKVLCSGSSEVYVWFHKLEKMYRFGPYSKTHATAGTFAFKKELLEITSYEDDTSMAEEKHFLKNYTIPFIQLDPLKTILVFSHSQNTYDKSKLLQGSENNPMLNESVLRANDFISNEELRKFYTSQLHEHIEGYELGELKYKPDVVEQTKKIEEMRRSRVQERFLVRKNEDGTETRMTLEDIVKYVNVLKQEIVKRNAIINQLLQKNIT